MTGRNTVFLKPEGTEGAIKLAEMNKGHRLLSEWGLLHLGSEIPAKILDIGCGGGMFISLLSEKYPQSSVSGIDHSEESVDYARKRNAAIIGKGVCSIERASVSELPFEDRYFDLVTAVETHYYWPDLAEDVKEACRVVSDTGKIMILAESYLHPDFKEQNERYAKDYCMNIVDADTIKDMLESNGFEVEVDTVEEKNWIVYVGKRIH